MHARNCARRRSKASKIISEKTQPTMQEIVNKEVMKLLDKGIIYLIASSEWVSPVHVVPKKTGFTVQMNDKGEMVPMRKTTG